MEEGRQEHARVIAGLRTRFLALQQSFRTYNSQLLSTLSRRVPDLLPIDAGTDLIAVYRKTICFYSFIFRSSCPSRKE